MIFVTDRFLVRELRTEDFADFYDMQSNQRVMQYIKAPLNFEESKIELEKFIGYYAEDATRYFKLWAIEDKSNSGFVGICGVYQNESKENEIAYRLRVQYWGKGIGREIAKGLIAYCFQDLGFDRIVANADEDNIGSVKILDSEMVFAGREYSEGRDRYSRSYFLTAKSSEVAQGSLG